MRVHITFKADRFNLSEEKENFINPCCFGEDLAAWLKPQLEDKSYEVNEPGQEDWGWYLDVRDEEQWYFLAMSGNSDEVRDNPNLGEWRIIVEKQRSLMEKLRGKNKLSEEERILTDIQSILSAQEDLKSVVQETEGT